MKFGNILTKLKMKDEWNIYSGCHKIGILKKENTLHYLYLTDKNMVCSIEEFEEILNICKKKAGIL